MSWSPVRYADQRALPVVRVDRSSRRLRLSGLRASASGRWRLSTISCTARSAQCWPARAPWQSTWSRHGWRRRRWGGRLPYYASCSIHRLARSTGRWPLSPVASPPGRHCVGRCPHWHSGLGRRASAAAICPRSPGTGAPSRRRGSAVRRHEETTGCTGRISGKRSVPPSPRSAEQRDGVAADLGGEHVAEVGKEGAALQAAGDRGREQPRDGALALLGLAAQRQLAVDHRAAQAALGVVVGGLDAGHAREAPEGRPALQPESGWLWMRTSWWQQRVARLIARKAKCLWTPSGSPALPDSAGSGREFHFAAVPRCPLWQRGGRILLPRFLKPPIQRAHDERRGDGRQVDGDLRRGLVCQRSTSAAAIVVRVERGPGQVDGSTMVGGFEDAPARPVAWNLRPLSGCCRMSEKKRVIVLEELAPESIELLRSDGLEVDAGTGWDEDELLRRIPGCHGLIVGPAHVVTAEILRAGGDLQVVGRTGLSVANVDVAEATRRGIVVANTPQSNVICAAELALAMVLACARDLMGTHADLRAGRWEPDKWARSSVEVRGRTLGIVGLGHVAPLLAEDALALGMKVLACDPLVPAERSPELAMEAVDDPGRIYAEADFIAVDLPSGAQTEGLIGDDEFAQMKDGVRLISLARPGIVDPAAPG